MVNYIELIMLSISLVTLLILFTYIANIKKKGMIHKEFMVIMVSLSIYVLGFILQILFSNTNIPLVKFEYISFIGMATSPVLSLYIAMTYYNGEKFNVKKHLYLFVIPIITILIMWIDDSFIFKNYSINLGEIEYGLWFYVYTIYTYLMYGIALILILSASIKKSGFLSLQSIFISLGAVVPIIANVFLVTGIVKGSVYITPILFSFMIFCFFIAIIKFKAFNITPIAFRTIIDTMSDAYIVISNDGTIVDNNHTFHGIFKDILNDNKDDNFFEMLDEKKLVDVNDLKNKIDETRKKRRNSNC